jgi:recombination-promoting nuclease RpnB
MQRSLIPNFGLLDVHKIPDEEFQKRGLLGIAEYMLKHGARKDFYKEAENKSPMLLHSFSTLTQLPSKSLLMKATSYLLNQEKDSSLIIERLTEFLPQETTDTIMTLAQALETKGRQRGIQKGRQEGQVLILERLLQKRFGETAVSYFPTVEKTPESSLDDLMDKILKAETIDDLLKD